MTTVQTLHIAPVTPDNHIESLIIRRARRRLIRRPRLCISNAFPYPLWFQDPRVTGTEGPLAWFQAALRGVEAEIATRNAERMQPYPYLQPSLIPTSINI